VEFRDSAVREDHNLSPYPLQVNGIDVLNAGSGGRRSGSAERQRQTLTFLIKRTVADMVQIKRRSIRTSCSTASSTTIGDRHHQCRQRRQVAAGPAEQIIHGVLDIRRQRVSTLITE
jgi:hypothetical protein